MLGGADSSAAPKIEWMNDKIRPLIAAEAKKKAEQKNQLVMFFSEYPPIQTFRVCDKDVEIGLRDDGVVVWRKAP